MPLSKDEKRLANSLGQRHLYFIYAGEQACNRMASFTREQIKELHQRIALSPYLDSDSTRGNDYPRLHQLEPFIQFLESRVEYHRQRNTPDDAAWLLKSATTGTGAMNAHVQYNHPRVAGAARMALARLHRELHDKLREEREARKAMEKEKENRLNQAGKSYESSRSGRIATKTAKEPKVKPNKDDDDDQDKTRPVYEPSDLSRAARQLITMEDFVHLPSKALFNNTFFVDDPNYPPYIAEDLTAFKIRSRKETAEGFLYEVLWEGLDEPMDTSVEELQRSAERGLWMSTV